MASWSTCTTTSFEQEILQLIRARGGTQQYPYPSNVNPFGIVSIKLSGQKNYNPWHEQMVCLIESHGLQGFIDGRFKNPRDNDDSQSTEGETTKYEEWKRSDSLVKGWIFGSLNENVMGTVVGLPTAMDVWKKLNTTYATHNFNGTQQYPYPSHVQPNNFISTQLSGQDNYKQWQEQMVCLIESHAMQGFINGGFKNPKENIDDSQNIEGNATKYEEWKRSDSLVKGWIFGSLSEDVMDVVIGIPTSMDVWKKLNTTYNTNNKGTQQYPYPSHVQPNNFVSIVLSGEKNYDRWREQMECLIESHGMRGFIEGRLKNLKHIGGTTNYEEWKRSDSLVKEWIFGSLNENIKGEVVDLPTTWDVWEHLNSFHSALTASDDIGLAKHIALHRAIVQGDWNTAQRHFNEDKNALTVKLNRWGHRPLHVAVQTNANIPFLRKLLKEIDPESLPFIVDNVGHTPLHFAAIVGNHEAAKMLVETNPKLLFISNKGKYLPLPYAAYRPHKKTTFQYLLKASSQHIQLSETERYVSPFEGMNRTSLLQGVILEGILDIAYLLIEEDPCIASSKFDDRESPLSCMAGKLEIYYSGTQYNLYQRFIYSHVPINEMEGGESSDNIQDIENQEKVSRCWRSCFHTCLIQFYFNYPLHYFIRRIYVKFWEITLLHVPHIKHLKEDKVKHNNALTLLRYICQEVGKLPSYNGIKEHLYRATNAAARNNTSEAIREIITHFPQAYDLTHQISDYNIIQLAIKNRSEKVYNLLVHDLSTKNLINKARVDKDGNNLLHLAGELAPIHRINLVSGAALQMQRELQWFKEVEKLVERKQMKAKNKKQETPFMMFRREHSKLRKEGEEWMKKTADSYTITAILIITIVFAAAITVPGGNNDTGKPVYAPKTSFTVFAVSDAISLFTSTTSLLLFLSILTARYRDEDFLYRLPKRLILGLVMLFLSVTSLMVAFSATLYLTLGHEEAWILIPIATLTCLPITSFVTLQFPLLVELISSTYGSGIFGKMK